MSTDSSAPEATRVTALEIEQLMSLNPPVGAPADRTVLVDIIEQARRNPGARAVTSGDADLSYVELLNAASSMAAVLRDSGVGSGSLVGLCAERSPHFVVAVLAVLLSGAAYVPLDPLDPPRRVRQLIAIASPDLLLIGTGAPEGLDDLVAVRDLEEVARLEPGPLSTQTVKLCLAAATVEPTSLAYVIFTSGTTGVPKGVEMSHASLANRLRWMSSAFELAPADVFLFKTPHTFDVSVWELLVPFVCGGRMVVAPAGAHRDPREIAQLVAAESVTVIHFVPSMLAVFLAEPSAAAATTLRLLICSGEALASVLVVRAAELLTSTQVYNLYGPTEAAIDVTYWACRPDSDARDVPIGRPIANVEAFVVDDRCRLLPRGRSGELVVGGHCLARGYAGRPDLTAERFVTLDLGSGQAPRRVYRTGDLVRWSDAGVLIFLGRIDDQVKIRGQRVELGEVASMLGGHPQVRDSVAIMRDDLGSVPMLVAYAVLRESPAPGEACPIEVALRDYLAKRLPAHMVPMRCVIVTHIPTSAHGKVDRAGLPRPERRAAARRRRPR